MSELNEKLLQAATGEKRLNPDEQRLFLGTFKERVVLTILMKDCQSNLIDKHLNPILTDLKQSYPTITLKINGQLPSTKQLLLLEKVKNLNIIATIVNDSSSHSPYAVVVHTNTAENLMQTDVKILFPQFWKQESHKTEPSQKKGFWQTLFGK